MRGHGIIAAATLPLAWAAPAAATPRQDAAAAFARMAALEGAWAPAGTPSPLRIRFSRTARGTVLAETWERDGRPWSLTLYHLDGDRIVATHYCPQGNQPRLATAPGAPALRFAFRDATDLDAGESHLHALAFDLADPARPVRRETYRRGRVDEPESVLVLARLPD